MRFLHVLAVLLLALLVGNLDARGQTGGGWLGLHIDELSADDLRARGLPDNGAVVVKWPAPGSAAEEAGLRRRDVVLALDGAAVHDTTSFIATVSAKPPGSLLMLDVVRGGKRIALSATLRARPAVPKPGTPLIEDTVAFFEAATATAKPRTDLAMQMLGLDGDHHSRYYGFPFRLPYLNEDHRQAIVGFLNQTTDAKSAILTLDEIRDVNRLVITADQTARLQIEKLSIVLTAAHRSASLRSIASSAQGKRPLWVTDVTATWLDAETAAKLAVAIADLKSSLSCDTAPLASSSGCAQVLFIESFAGATRDDDRSLALLRRAIDLHDATDYPALGPFLHRAVLSFLPQLWDEMTTAERSLARFPAAPLNGAMTAGQVQSKIGELRIAALAYLKHAKAVNIFEPLMHAEAVAARVLGLFEGQADNKRLMVRNVVAQMAPVLDYRVATGLNEFGLWNKIHTTLLETQLSADLTTIQRLVGWNYDFNLHQTTPFAAAGTDFFPESLWARGPENLLYEKLMDPARWQQRVARLEQVLEPRFEGDPNYACGANPEAACALIKAAAIIDQFGNHSNSALHFLQWAVDVFEGAKPADGQLYCRTLISRGRYEVQQGEIAAAEKTLAKATALAGPIDDADWRCDDALALWEVALDVARARLDQSEIERALSRLIDLSTANDVEADRRDGVAVEVMSHLIIWDCEACDGVFRDRARDYLAHYLDRAIKAASPTKVSLMVATRALAHRHIVAGAVCRSSSALMAANAQRLIAHDATVDLCESSPWTLEQRTAAQPLIAGALAIALTTRDAQTADDRARLLLAQMLAVQAKDRRQSFDQWFASAFNEQRIMETLLDPRWFLEAMHTAVDAARTLSDDPLELAWLEMARDQYERYTTMFARSTTADVLKQHSNPGVRARQLLPTTLHIHVRLAELANAAGDRPRAKQEALRALALAEARLSREWSEEEGNAVAAMRPALAVLKRMAAVLHDLARQNGASDTPDQELTAAAFTAMQLAQLSDTSLSVVATLRRKRDEAPETAALIRRNTNARETYWSFKGNLYRGGVIDNRAFDAEGDVIERDFRAAERALNQQRAKEDPHLSVEPVSMTGVQAALRADEAVLLSLVQPDATRFVLITAGAVRLWSADISRPELVTAIADLRRPLERPGDGERFSPAASARLYQRVLSPLDVLRADGVTKLFVVPDGPLHSLPLGVLVTETPKQAGPIENFREARIAWLIRSVGIAVLPSMPALIALRKASDEVHTDLRFFGIGDPLLDGHPDRARVAQTRALRGRNGRIDPNLISALPSLPETRFELEQVANLVSRGRGAALSRLLLGSAATRRAVLGEDFSAFDIISFATHGAVAGDFDGVVEPGLILTPVDGDDHGFLSASDISHLKLRASLVILSACNTAAGDGRPQAEGLSGLARSFFSAGARSVLATSWSIPSEPTVTLMIETVTQRLADPSLDWTGALRRATLAMIDTLGPDYNADPLAWGAFLVAGDAEPQRK